MTLNSHYTIRHWVLAGLFSALTAVGAFVRIPLPYVPFTLQLVFVLLAGDILTPKFAALSQIIYLLIGLLGLPVFANGGGPGYVAHPTFGYLAAFPIAAWLVSWLLRSHFGVISSTAVSKVRDLLVVNTIGVLVICVLGVAYLYININYIVSGKITLGTAIWIGMIVFIPGDIIKVILTSLIARKLQIGFKSGIKNANF